MVNLINFSTFGLALFSSLVSAGGKCDKDSKCPKSAPCCSTYGSCGATFEYCGIGCDAEGSFKPASCLKPPVCESKKYDFKDANRMKDLKEYDGNFLKTDFLTSGNVEIKDGQLWLEMTKEGGAKMSLARYAQYAKITASMRTSRTKGVISSFITMSDVKDEIDWEFVGNNLNEGQTNVFYRGNIDYTKGKKHAIEKNTFNSSIAYTIDWTENNINWMVDGKVVRSYKKEDSIKDDIIAFPSTPSRIEFGIWNGGAGAEGTREWAGGEVDWNDPETADKGYYYVIVDWIEVECIGSFNGTTDEDVKTGKLNTDVLSGKVHYTGNANRNSFSLGFVTLSILGLLYLI
ncbi:glycoside hydrolase family 16 protein [Conidiobolus coronatus NRRL 28638]|uniref:Glycoside hydrolase family 16 protein n=1 Tax=Conidiobolus coronatus (strain ATCC 28846 / CBS 209.66 / NRRL 28638) TaxID=796925 RepID=A0A137PD63_CONC2|nr:glycoside hydrolase family 16 protein [Conidiobolus coronatus NRRL 28638]|eukprot:KXN72949.1 glycoside hydrolase family 16 protein [Conidiobolus coronatus NRRL 28638]